MDVPSKTVPRRIAAFVTMGATGHSLGERPEHDYYATEPRTIDDLFSVESFEGKIWEPACGAGHLSARMSELGAEVHSTDLIDRGYGAGGVDFLAFDQKMPATHIVTNPPFKIAQKFVERALETVEEGHKVAMFLKLTFLEGQARHKFYKQFPPKTIYVYSSRRLCAKNGDFNRYSSPAMAYAWFVWEKGSTSEPIIRWLP